MACVLRSLASLLPVLVLVLVPGVAIAQTNQLPSDPDADSPSGTMYEIPLEKARKDAAPERTRRGAGGLAPGGTGTGGGDATGDGRESLYRSENNFGSSSEIPGVDADARETDAPGANGGTSRGQGARDGTSQDGDDGRDATDRERSIDDVASASTTTSGPSNAVVIPLLALLLAVGAVVGIAASRRRRGSSTR